MKLAEYTNTLKGVLMQDEGCVILINGPWGVGKTHFWHEFSKNELGYKAKEEDCSNAYIVNCVISIVSWLKSLFNDEVKKVNSREVEKKNKIAYVSLFGKKDIKEIESEALIQILTKNMLRDAGYKFLSSFNGSIGLGGLKIGVPSNSLGILLSLTKSKALNDSYICIDDFERKSDELKAVEVLGYASILAEVYSCKVILIMDEGKIEDDSEKKKLNVYKEKTVNFEIKFEPEHSDVVANILKDLEKSLRDGALEAIKFANINNLRTIKKIKLWLSLFKASCDIKFDDDFDRQLSFKISLLAMVYFELGNNGLSDVSGYNSDKKESESEEGKKIAFFKSKVQNKISPYSAIDIILWDFLGKQRLDTIGLKREYDKGKKHSSNTAIREGIENLIHRYTYDLTYKREDVVKDAKELLINNNSVLLTIINPDSLDFVIDSLVKISGEKDYFENLKDDIYMNYINNRIDKISTPDEVVSMLDSKLLSKIIEDNPEIKDTLDRKKKELQSILNKSEYIQKLLKQIPNGNGWNPREEKILDSLPVDYLSDSILNCSGFLEDMSNFIRWCSNFANTKPFNGFKNNAITAIKNLGRERLGDFRYNRLKFLLGFGSEPQ